LTLRGAAQELLERSPPLHRAAATSTTVIQ
jgi:hypothetical protein